MQMVTDNPDLWWLTAPSNCCISNIAYQVNRNILLTCSSKRLFCFAKP